MGAALSSRHYIPASVAQPFYKLWRYDYESSTCWQWTCQPQPITLPQLVQLYSPYFRLVGEYAGANRIGSELHNASRLIIPRTAPFHKFWRYDYVPEPAVWIQPSYYSVSTSNIPQGRPFSKFWRYDLVPEPFWSGQPLSAYTQTQLDHRPTSPTKFWRWDHVPPTDWLGTPRGIPNQTRAFKLSPFYRQWRYDYNSATELWLRRPIGSRIPYFPVQVANQLLRNVIVRTRELVNELERERELRNAIIRSRVLPFGGPTYH